MITKINRILAVGLVSCGFAAALTSCDDYLEVTPKSAISTENFYQTDAQMDQALTGVYGCLKPIALYSLQMSEQRSDNMWITNDTKQNDQVDIALFNPDALVNDLTIYNCWADYFKIVAASNKLLDKLDEVTLSDASLQVEYRAEARFLRALAYFDLVRFFGRVPAPTHSLTTEEAFALGQSEAVDVYENVIVPDLEYAVENLPLTAPQDNQGVSHSERATKNAARALLGRVYLTMAGYPLYQTDKADKAATLLKEVIDYAEQSNKYWASTMDAWERMWLSENDNKYFIFEIQYVNAVDQGNPYTPVSSTSPKYSTWCNPKWMVGTVHIYCETSLRLHYQEKDSLGNVIDQRAYGTISDAAVESDDGTLSSSNDLIFVKFFENNLKRAKFGLTGLNLVDRTCWPQNYPLIRLEDVMLMYAEIVGPTTEGLRLVNKIRTRAGLEALPATITAADFQEAVANERRYELAGEGLRWHDLVRRNEYVETIRQMFINDDTTSDQSYAALASRVTTDSYLYPIPLKQIEVRAGLYTQNPGY